MVHHNGSRFASVVAVLAVLLSAGRVVVAAEKLGDADLRRVTGEWLDGRCQFINCTHACDAYECQDVEIRDPASGALLLVICRERRHTGDQYWPGTCDGDENWMCTAGIPPIVCAVEYYAARQENCANECNPTALTCYRDNCYEEQRPQ